VYNALSNGLAKVDKALYALLQEGEIPENHLDNPSLDQLWRELRKGHILVDRDLDEIALIRSKFEMSKYSTDALVLTICPTLNCNLDCIYCFEGNKSGTKHLDEGGEDAIMKFVSDRWEQFRYRQISVTWFGGEPFLNMRAVTSLSRKFIAFCKKRRINYSSVAVTNGTILNKKIALKLKAAKIINLQITIDGPKETHDKRRPYKSHLGKHSSFEAIISNLKRAYGVVPITVRINVDKTNNDKAVELISSLQDMGLMKDEKKLRAYIGYTREWTDNCTQVVQDCFTSNEYAKADFDFNKRLAERGLQMGLDYPAANQYCAAASPHSFLIEPDGSFHKCWSNVGNKSEHIGNIERPDEIDQVKLLTWTSYDILKLDKTCEECSLLPICAGGCPYVQLQQKDKLYKDGQYNCTHWKPLMQEKMRSFIDAKTQNANILPANSPTTPPQPRDA
jgi:uncharacterized protein